MSNVVFSNVHLNFSFDSDSLFSRIETILYQWAQKDLSDVFDKVFEDRDVDDADLYLENVDFDLGDVPEGFFLSETCSRLKEKLEQLLYPKIEKQRKSTYLKILLSSCKKIAPEIEASQIEEIFSSVYRAEESKETIIRDVISILKKIHPDLSFDEMADDVLNELDLIKSQKKNVYLLNVLEKIYFSFFDNQEEPFIQSFLISTVPHYFSDGYLDLLKHFILEMQEKYPELSDIQNSKNLFFEALKDNKNADLKQIFSDICASVLPGNSSTFINDFIARTKESVPAITTLGIVILFIDELKQKYPHLNDFRLSNFNEDKLSDLSKIYWKEDIKEILWDIYKSILQDEASHSENPISEEGKQNQERASISEDVLDKAEEFNAEKTETAESNDSSDDVSESKTAENEFSESENLETKSSSDENKSEESTDENPTSQESKQNQENTSVSDDVQDKTEDFNVEKSETAESDDSSNDVSESKTAESKAAENEFSESEDLESKSSSDENKLAESTDIENSKSEEHKQNQESENVSDEVQDKAEDLYAEKSGTAESDDSGNDDSESKTAESKAVESDFSESEDLESESSSDENKPEESTDAEKPTSEEHKQNQENTSISEDVQDEAEALNAEKSETAKSDDASDDASESKTAESKTAENEFSESENLETKSSSDENKPEESTDAEKPTSEEGKQNQENTSVSDDVQDKAEDLNAEKSETAESDDASDDASESKTAESKATESDVSENGAKKQSQFKANTTQVQTSEAFDKIFNECIAENSSPEKNTSPLQVTESFISKLQKEFPDKAAPASAIKAYQKATELEMKYNSTVDDKNEIVVKDAGLVLIGAYVPMLFKKLEYIADGAFISEQTRLKACSLLRYIVFGDLPSDGLHFLGNYFCGLPWNFRIPKEIVLDENEKNIAESLIKSVIDNWKAIGHVSIDGFRGTFLHRDGKIEKEMDEEIHLKVKQGPFDMLLDKLPWSYSMLKFKWHKKLLTTTWR